jgi:hypothetical protein
MKQKTSRFVHITEDGRRVVDVNRLLKSKQVQDTLRRVQRVMDSARSEEPAKV